MAYFCHENVDNIADDVKCMYELIEVLDENGQDMIYDRIDTPILM